MDILYFHTCSHNMRGPAITASDSHGGPEASPTCLMLFEATIVLVCLGSVLPFGDARQRVIIGQFYLVIEYTAPQDAQGRKDEGQEYQARGQQSIDGNMCVGFWTLYLRQSGISTN